MDKSTPHPRGPRKCFHRREAQNAFNRTRLLAFKAPIIITITSQLISKHWRYSRRRRRLCRSPWCRGLTRAACISPADVRPTLAAAARRRRACARGAARRRAEPAAPDTTGPPPLAERSREAAAGGGGGGVGWGSPAGAHGDEKQTHTHHLRVWSAAHGLGGALGSAAGGRSPPSQSLLREALSAHAGPGAGESLPAASLLARFQPNAFSSRPDGSSRAIGCPSAPAAFRDHRTKQPPRQTLSAPIPDRSSTGFLFYFFYVSFVLPFLVETMSLLFVIL